MSDRAPEGAAEGAAVDHPQTVSQAEAVPPEPAVCGEELPEAPVSLPPAEVVEPEPADDPRIDRVLADFRSWLAEVVPAPEEPVEGEPELDDRQPAGEPVDLHALVGHFVALRQEVNLQTRAVRNQQEQNAASLNTLQQALAGLERARGEARQEQQSGQEERLRPLLKALVDLYDALSLANREIGRVTDALGPDLQSLTDTRGWGHLLDELAQVEEPHEPAPVLRSSHPPFWSGLFGRRAVEAPAEAAQAQPRETNRAICARIRQQMEERMGQVREQGERVRQALGAVVTGYTMSLQRVERALRQQGLEPIATVGQPFDPERMEVLEAVSGTGRPSGEVVEEVRRGYLWNGRVFRFASVRVARGL
jgi:molecular chaperone GrpE